MTVKKEKEFVINNVQLMAEWDWQKNNELGFHPNEITSHSGKKSGGFVLTGILLMQRLQTGLTAKAVPFVLEERC